MRMFCNNRDCKEARMAENLKAIDETIAIQSELVHHLANVLEFVKGNRGTKQGNPYDFTEIKDALKHLAKLEGTIDYLNVDTRKLSGWICKKCSHGHFRCSQCTKPYCSFCNNETCPYCKTKW